MERQPCVYILASKRHGTLYVGVTSDLTKRLHEHRSGLTGGFVSGYAVKRLVHFEIYQDMTAAVTREKQLKNWKRDWKIALIESSNPLWDDLATGLGFEPL